MVLLLPLTSFFFIIMVVSSLFYCQVEKEGDAKWDEGDSNGSGDGFSPWLILKKLFDWKDNTFVSLFCIRVGFYKLTFGKGCYSWHNRNFLKFPDSLHNVKMQCLSFPTVSVTITTCILYNDSACFNSSNYTINYSIWRYGNFVIYH